MREVGEEEKERMVKNPQNQQNQKNSITVNTRWVSGLHWRVLLLIPSLTFLLFLSLLTLSITTNSNLLRTLFYSRTPPRSSSFQNTTAAASARRESGKRVHDTTSFEPKTKEELLRSRIAVCLVGGARRFELTGPSIVERVLKEYPNSDLFLHSPLDPNSYKLSLLKIAPRIASIRIFSPKILPENESQLRVLTASNSPNGIQGLLQYFNLVEGCLTLIREYQTKNDFTYDWIIRTRVDGYWNAPLGPENFIPGHYVVPPGSSYGGLNDRLGVGDFNTSVVALSRLSLIPKLDSAGLCQLNSESSFKAQLTTSHVPHLTKRIPFCIVTDRRYRFPPSRFGVPVAAMSSPGPLSGAKCRPCTLVCDGPCVANVMMLLNKGWSWTDWGNGELQLCDAHGPWEKNWSQIFDKLAGRKLAKHRKRVGALKVSECVNDFEEMRRRAGFWDVPPSEEICKIGLDPK
ncbi:hypothetical protein RJ641_028772 [Dillenia turbinata]|uniref:DUF7796 domain-containing protein n=1 Tax=Dillenia turbinata TaxID=194707 RepID=A0AAN8ZIJ7_9MAGN